MSSHESRCASPWLHAGRNFGAQERQTVDQEPEEQPHVDDAPEKEQPMDFAATDLDGRAPFPTRVRMIFMLAIACWALLVLAAMLLSRL